MGRKGEQIQKREERKGMESEMKSKDRLQGGEKGMKNGEISKREEKINFRKEENERKEL